MHPQQQHPQQSAPLGTPYQAYPQAGYNPNGPPPALAPQHAYPPLQQPQQQPVPPVMGQAVAVQQQPQQQVMMMQAPPQCQPQPQGPASITVEYLAPTCCGSCCGFGQLDQRCAMDFFVNGREVGYLRQGGKSSYPVAPGSFRIGCKEAGVGGAISRFFGSDSGGCQVLRTVGPGQEAVVTIGWRSDCCGSSRHYPFME